MRADQLAHFVSCLVYLPRDRYTTAVRLEMQDILVRELGGVSIDYAARVSESPWAVVHFTVRLPEGSTSAGRRRLARATRRASRTCSPRPPAPGATGCSARCKTGSIDQATAEHYAGGVPRGVQAGRHAAATRSTTSRSSKSCKTIRSSWCSPTARRDGRRAADLVSGRPVGVAEPAAADAAVDGRRGARGAAVHRDPPRRLAGVDLPVQGLAAPRHPRGARGARARAPMAQRFADAVTAIWHGRAEIDRFNELVLRAGLTWQQVAVLRSYAKYLRQAGFPYSQSHIETVHQRQRRHRALAGRAVRGAVRPGRRAGRRRNAATRRRPRPRSPPTSTRWSASTPTGCCARSPR